MIRHIVLLLLISVFTAVSYSQERKIPSESKIERVIVFLQGAQVERAATLSIPSGISIIEFGGLSPDIDEQSIQVKGTGNFTILSVNRQNNFLNEQKYNEEIKVLEDKIANLRTEIEREEAELMILGKEQEILAANQSIGNGGAGLDLNKLKLALEFHKQRLTENRANQIKTQKTLDQLRVQLSAVQQQASELRAKGRSNTSDIAVKVDSKIASIGSFKITYLVKNASWYPSYDLRATDVNKPIDLIYRANITQRSGEEWNNVKLVLSSGDPSRGGNKPVLKPYRVGYNVFDQGAASAITSVQGRVVAASGNLSLPGVIVRVKGSSIATTTNQQGAYSIQIPSPGSVLVFSLIGYENAERPVTSSLMNVSLNESVQMLSEVVTTGYSSSVSGKVAGVAIRGNSSMSSTIPLEVDVLQGQTTVQFDVAQPYSISSDGKQLTVQLSSNTLNADYKYFAVPKLSENAYLTAAITGINDLSLMSGEANIFFEGAFLGKTLLNVQNTSDTLSISLGVDRNIIVKRVRQKEENEKSFTGATQRATRSFLYSVLNRKTAPVNVTVEDQLPISNSSEVTVERQELSNAKVDEPTGTLSWDLQLQPNEKKEFQMRYQVRYPRNKPVRLE
ncbi:mucoidy inhibitor MuiA family protein [Daejeonella lutea]|uniref:Mucoidy inhibitor MuiA family protein n=1 Tax=Daejeonella lutea TaxID=572036 RepID=A0A1T5EAJ8_9SPHI|nr:mucoidy inhibitor MuiA family protein [Daejeonella lutea]SKB80891.1 conserved hypothetical protein [Daejeonella lutea]